MKNIKCQFCGQDAYRLALTAMLQDLGCSTNNPADKCWAREDGLPHDFDEPKQVVSANSDIEGEDNG